MCKDFRFSSHTFSQGPAVKVPGLVFCAGQTAIGEIKQATVSSPLFGLANSCYFEILISPVLPENGAPELEGSS